MIGQLYQALRSRVQTVDFGRPRPPPPRETRPSRCRSAISHFRSASRFDEEDIVMRTSGLGLLKASFVRKSKSEYSLVLSSQISTSHHNDELLPVW